MNMPERGAFSPTGQRGKILINGKFLSAGPTGVHRVAEELVRGLDLLLADQQNGTLAPIEILCPNNIRHAVATRSIRQRKIGVMSWVPWEQLELPLSARGHLLINLCNLGPLVSHHAITMIHDAQIYLTPRSYPRPFRLWYRFSLPLLGRRHAAILTVSDYSREQLVRFGVAPRDRITVIHNGADHILRVVPDRAIVDRLALTPRRYACALANTQAHKNIAMLLRTFADHALDEMKLVLIGSADRAAFKALGHAVPPNVVFAGRVSDAELRGLLGDALCFLCPSTTEGFGLPPLESMLLGTPAIVAPEGALPEVCGAAALYADAADCLDWARKLRQLADEPAVWRMWSDLGRERATTFTWRKAALRLIGVIERVSMNGRAAARPRS